MAQAVSAHTLSTFVEKLLTPVVPPATSRRAIADMRREAEQAWSLVYHRYHAAQALCSHRAHLRRAAEIERRTLRTPEAGEEANARLDMIAAVDRLMHIPAPTMGALRQKEKLRAFDGGRKRWDVAIAADAARLERS